SALKHWKVIRAYLLWITSEIVPFGLVVGPGTGLLPHADVSAERFVDTSPVSAALMSALGQTRSFGDFGSMSASLIGRLGSSAFRLSTNSSVDVAHGLSLLFGLGTKGPSIMGFEDEVEQSFGRPCRQCDGRFKRTYELTSSIVPRGTSFHRGVELDFLLLHWILHRSQAAATSLVHRNSVPSTHTRCMITANRRASATIAFFIPRCLAIFIAQALSQDHFVERTSMIWAAS